MNERQRAMAEMFLAQQTRLTRALADRIIEEWPCTSDQARECLRSLEEGRLANGLTVPWVTGDDHKDAITFAKACNLIDWAITAALDLDRPELPK